MANVRAATLDDLGVLVEMGRAMHRESPRYRSMQFDSEKVRKLSANLIGSDTAAVFVAQAASEVVGMAAIVAGQRWFGPDFYLTDLVVYVRPEHRGNGAFVRLVLAIEGWARLKGITQIDLGVSTGVDPERAVRAYERLGYTVSDTRVVTKRLDDVHRS